MSQAPFLRVASQSVADANPLSLWRIGALSDSERRHDERVLDKSATGYEALAGLTAQLNPLVRWHLLGGYGIRDFDSTTIGRSTTSMFEAGVQWLPTQLMTISANAKRGYSEGVDSDGEHDALRGRSAVDGPREPLSTFVAAA